MARRRDTTHPPRWFRTLLNDAVFNGGRVFAAALDDRDWLVADNFVMRRVPGYWLRPFRAKERDYATISLTWPGEFDLRPSWSKFTSDAFLATAVRVEQTAWRYVFNDHFTDTGITGCVLEREDGQPVIVDAKFLNRLEPELSDHSLLMQGPLVSDQIVLIDSCGQPVGTLMPILMPASRFPQWAVAKAAEAVSA